MKRIIVAVSLFMAALMLFSACDSGSGKTYYELTEKSYYDSTDYEEGSDKAVYNEDLFYRNDRETDIADPFVLYIDEEESSEYGYYYLYGTTSASYLECFRSKDLVDWEPMGVCLNPKDGGSEVASTVYKDVWAPEVIYDSDLGKYILFFSATPLNNKKVEYVMLAATSDSPAGPFEVCDFTDYGRETGVTLENGTTYQFNDSFAKYLYFDQAQFVKKVVEDFGLVSYQNVGYVPAIDPHPYVETDENGNTVKYMIAALGAGKGVNYLIGVPAKNGDWFDLDYSQMKILTKAAYYTPDGDEINPAEGASNQVNEGPTITKHNGMYYLTMSINGYGDRSYAVIQAVSDSVLGDYRKLTPEEGGVLLSTDGLSMDLVSGPGHHSFIERDGQMYIIYHKHNNPDIGGGARHVNVDKVEWVTIINKDGEEMDVMYCNGPTTTIQPRFEFASDYKNIASEADVNVTNLESGSSAEYLTDGLLSLYKYANEDFINNYIKETYVTKKTTITLSFDDYKTIRALMIYNSKWIETSFKEVERIEFDSLDAEGNEVTKVIRNLKFDWKYNVYVDDNGMIREASAAIAEFNEMQVKTIRITIDVPTKGWVFDENGNPVDPEESYMAFEHEKRVGLSEIVVLGAKA